MPTLVSKPGSLGSLCEERIGVMKRKRDRVNNP
jgi:hypothetical protein